MIELLKDRRGQGRRRNHFLKAGKYNIVRELEFGWLVNTGYEHGYLLTIIRFEEGKVV